MLCENSNKSFQTGFFIARLCRNTDLLCDRADLCVRPHFYGITEPLVLKLLCTDSNINPDYGDTRLSSSTLSLDAPEPQSHVIYSTASKHTFAVKLAAGETWILFTGINAAVAFREISSTAALMELLLPIEIHVAVCKLQATHRPTIAGLLLQNCVIQVSLLRCLWNSGAALAGVHRGAAIDFGKQYSK